MHKDVCRFDRYAQHLLKDERVAMATPDSIRRTPRSRTPKPTYQYGDHLDDRFVINGFAGMGATSFVYRARRLDSFEPVAIKVLHPHLLKDPIKRRRFLREARVMMQLDHSNVVRFHEIIERDDMLAFVMEYIDGWTLSQWRDEVEETLSEIDLASVFVDILRGLTCAHRAGIIHRDLKPANILITHERGRYLAKIIDFGVAKVSEEGIPEDERSKILGTAAYISPEEVQDPMSVCEASDIYSIGVMLYEAACGRRPFQNMPVGDIMQAHVGEAPPRPSAFNPRITPAFESVILKTLQKQPDGRFASAPQMMQALELALRGAMAMNEEEWAAITADEHAETKEWSREVEEEVAQTRQRGALFGFLRRCFGGALTLLTATGATGQKGDPHHLTRTPRSDNLPFGV